MDWNCFKILYFYLNFINVKYEIVLCTPYSKAQCSPPPPRLNNVKRNCTFLLWRLPFLTSVCHITLINIYFQGISPLGILFWAFPFMRTSLTKKTLLSFFWEKIIFLSPFLSQRAFLNTFFSTFLRTFYLEHFLEGFFEHYLECACLTREPYFLETLFWVRTLFWALPWAI